MAPGVGCNRRAAVHAGALSGRQRMLAAWKSYHRTSSTPSDPPGSGPDSLRFPAETRQFSHGHNWMRYPEKNCWWDGNGADEVDWPNGRTAPGYDFTLEGCMQLCASSPACEGFLVSIDLRSCYRKRNIKVDRCIRPRIFFLCRSLGS